MPPSTAAKMAAATAAGLCFRLCVENRCGPFTIGAAHEFHPMPPISKRGNLLMSRRLTMRVVVRLLALVVLLDAVLAASATPAPNFPREVRPLLEQHCFKCHGPEKQKGGLRFD